MSNEINNDSINDLSHQSQEKPIPKGLGGWLIMVGVGLFSALLESVNGLFRLHREIFFSGLWDVATTRGTDGYNPLLVPTAVVLIIFSIIMLAGEMFLVYLFFAKKKIFPKWYIIIAIAHILFCAINAFSIFLIHSDATQLDPGSKRYLSHAIVSAMIWIPYMRVSERVKATFIRWNDPATEKLAPQGLGGWLILVGINVVFLKP